VLATRLLQYIDETVSTGLSPTLDTLLHSISIPHANHDLHHVVKLLIGDLVLILDGLDIGLYVLDIVKLLFGHLGLILDCLDIGLDVLYIGLYVLDIGLDVFEIGLDVLDVGHLFDDVMKGSSHSGKHLAVSLTEHDEDELLSII
jgi:hypothetical protein